MGEPNGPETALDSSSGNKLIRSLVDTINSKDPAARLQFSRSKMSELALNETPEQKLVAFLQRVYEQSMGITIMQISQSTDPLEVNVRTKQGNHWARIYIFRDKVQQGKIREFGLIPILDPQSEKEQTWPNKKMSMQERLKEVRKHIERLASRDVFSGVVLIGLGDKMIFKKSVGYAEKSFQVPNKVDTKFNLGSMNKMFTSIAVSQLVQAGRLSFKDELARILPEYPNKEAAHKITIYNLLTHTAGLGMLFDRPAYDRCKKYQTQADYFPIFANERLLFEPGSLFSYSNEGYVVLGAAIEKISGENYHDYVRQNIFKPARMHQTDAYTLDEVTPNLAVGYGRFEDDPFGIDPRRPNFMFLGWRGNAAGGGYSTAPDLYRFANALRTYKLLNRELTEIITTKQGFRRSQERNYGYGFETMEIAGKKIVGHSGGGTNSGVNSDLKIFLDGTYTVAVLGNYDAPAAQDLSSGITEFLAKQQNYA